MQYLKYILANVNLLNIILTVIIVLLLDYMLLPLLGMNIKYTPSSVKKATADAETEQLQSPSPSPSDFAIITEQNLFHPERKIPVVAKTEEKPVIPKPDIMLYGTLITDEISLAYIDDKKAPQSTPGRGKRQTVLKKGDTVGGYILKAIEADKIVMTKEDDTITIYLNDPQKPKTRESLASATPAAPQQPHAPKAIQPPEIQQRQQAVQEPVPTAEKDKQPLTPEKVDSARKAFTDFFKR